MLRKKIIMVVLLCLIAGPLMAQEPEVTTLMSKDLRWTALARKVW